MHDDKPIYTQDELDELQTQLEHARQQLSDLNLPMPPSPKAFGCST